MKKLIVMQGLPGSGKSHYVKKQFEGAVVCSADDHFMEIGGGTYKFDVGQLAAAHGKCFKKAVEAVTGGAETVVIDNTSTTSEEVAPYMALGASFGYETRIIRIDAHVDTCAERNVHGVPYKSILALSDRLRKFRALPYWEMRVERNQG